MEFGLRLTYSIGLIAALSFLGFGMQPPAADWGLMINENRVGIIVQPWPVVVPVILIAILTIGTNLIADGLSRALIGIERDTVGDERSSTRSMPSTVEGPRIVLDPSGVDIDDEVNFEHPPGRGAGARRRVGLGQDDRRHVAARLPAPRRQDRRRRASRSTAATSSRWMPAQLRQHPRRR